MPAGKKQQQAAKRPRRRNEQLGMDLGETPAKGPAKPPKGRSKTAPKKGAAAKVPPPQPEVGRKLKADLDQRRRDATVVYRRVLKRALSQGVLQPDWPDYWERELASYGVESAMHSLRVHVTEGGGNFDALADPAWRAPKKAPTPVCTCRSGSCQRAKSGKGNCTCGCQACGHGRKRRQANPSLADAEKHVKAAGKIARFAGRVAARTAGVVASAAGGAAQGLATGLEERGGERERAENPRQKNSRRAQRGAPPPASTAKTRRVKPNPSSVDDDMVDLLDHWHWGRYADKVRYYDMPQATWQPKHGIKAGRLYSITVGDEEIRVPQRPAHYVVFGLRPGVKRPPRPKGKRALRKWFEEYLEPFIVPPLPFRKAQAGEMTWIRYVAIKGDEDAIWEHPFEEPLPRADSHGGVLDTKISGSNCYIDPDRGFVG